MYDCAPSGQVSNRPRESVPGSRTNLQRRLDQRLRQPGQREHRQLALAREVYPPDHRFLRVGRLGLGPAALGAVTAMPVVVRQQAVEDGVGLLLLGGRQAPQLVVVVVRVGGVRRAGVVKPALARVGRRAWH